MKYSKLPLSYDDDEKVRQMAEKQKIPYIMAKEQFFENKEGLNKYIKNAKTL